MSKICFAICLKKLSFSKFMCLHSHWPISEPSILFHWSACLLFVCLLACLSLLSSHSLVTMALQHNLRLGIVIPTPLILLLKSPLFSEDILCFHLIARFFSRPTKSTIVILMKIESIDNFGNIVFSQY